MTLVIQNFNLISKNLLKNVTFTFKCLTDFHFQMFDTAMTFK